MPSELPIDYRTPGVGPHRVEVVVQLLAREEALGMAAAWGKLALGVALTLVGPLLVTVIVRGIKYRDQWEAAPPFAATLGLVSVVLVPLLLWYERRTRGRFVEDAIQGESRASSYGEYELQKSRFTWTMYVETALLGPRLLWHVYDWARGTPGVHQPVRVLAAAVAVDLLDAGEGVPVGRLVHPGHSPAEVQWALRYLVSRDWVGLSKARDRAWLCTPVRERLTESLRPGLDARGFPSPAARADDP